MGIQRLKPASGGTDWSKYTPLSRELTITNSPTALVYTTALSVTGKGYLSKAVVSLNISGIRITVDGSVVFESYGASSTGIILEDFLQNTNSSAAIAVRTTYIAVATNGFKSHPFIDSTTAGNSALVGLPQPLFFKTGFLIETRNSGANGVCSLSVLGGR